MEDQYNLARFVTAQDSDGTYRRALGELLSGSKQSHWMWFIFPQIAGLGRSPMSRTYALSSLAEAQAYLRHPVLGPRLSESAHAVCAVQGRTAVQIFGAVDAKKFHSSVTLFLRADPQEPVFRGALDQYFDGVPDAVTDQRLGLQG
jgi:uncharacterized protein (DUF1810 family)